MNKKQIEKKTKEIEKMYDCKVLEVVKSNTMGMSMVNFILEDENYPIQDPNTLGEFVLAYVYNETIPSFSEVGEILVLRDKYFDCYCRIA